MKFLPPGSTGQDRNDLMQAAFEFVLEAFEIKWLDGGERYAKLAYARDVLKEHVSMCESTRQLLKNNKQGSNA